MDILSAIWAQITVKDLIDITIVALLIYQMLLVVQGTKAVQMLLGVGALGVLFGLGNYYELYSLTWILEHFFDALIVLLVIVFQDQIRNTLATFGTGRRIFQRRTPADLDSKLREVAEACSIISKNKIGALIAFERQQGLMNYMTDGTFLDCNINGDILSALFSPSSPLHDGAVIISRGRIGAAGCFLPLSKNLKLDKRYGTRHRAGVGLSEVTDAIIIIVSEETGILTICKNGFAYEVKNSAELFIAIKKLWDKTLSREGDFVEATI